MNRNGLLTHVCGTHDRVISAARFSVVYVVVQVIHNAFLLKVFNADRFLGTVWEAGNTRSNGPKGLEMVNVGIMQQEHELSMAGTNTWTVIAAVPYHINPLYEDLQYRLRHTVMQYVRIFRIYFPVVPILLISNSN